MAAPEITLPETKTQLHKVFEGISNRLRLVFPEKMFDLQIMSPAPTKSEWQRVTRRKPCVAISWIDLKPSLRSARVVNGDANFAVYVIVDNTEVGRRYLGDERGIGLYGMVTAASFVLHGYTIDGVGTLQITDIGEVAKEGWADDTTAIAALSIKVPITVGEGVAGTKLNDFLRLGASWMANETDAGAGVITMES